MFVCLFVCLFFTEVLGVRKWDELKDGVRTARDQMIMEELYVLFASDVTDHTNSPWMRSWALFHFPQEVRLGSFTGGGEQKFFRNRG